MFDAVLGSVSNLVVYGGLGAGAAHFMDGSKVAWGLIAGAVAMGMFWFMGGP